MVSPGESPPRRGAAADRALPRASVARALPPRPCRSADLSTEEGRHQFATYLVGAMHGPALRADPSKVPKPGDAVGIDTLGLEGQEYKDMVQSCADACIIMC